jgi:hypothetical protein
MQTWEEMVKTALLGTERQAPPLQSGDTLLQPLLSQFNAEDRERALLGVAGALTLARRAGYLPAPVTELQATTAEATDLPICREEAANDLPALMDGEYESLLSEWLELVAAQGQRVPERWLPALLDKGARNKELRSHISPVLGNRGRWLATQNPAWQYGLQRTLFEADGTEIPADLTDAVWETGFKEERISYLAALRRTDPAQARAKLAAVWAQEGYEERAAFLKTFEAGLTMDDEPFLEAALDDKRKEVRTVAQELLKTLPESRFCQRMIDRARPLLSLTGNKLLGNKIEVTLPDAHDKAMARDGIEQKPPAYPKIGERAFWFSQILAATPLSFWTTHLDRTPEQLIKMAAAHKEWRDTLLNGWTHALECPAGRQEWAEPLLHYWLEPKSSNTPQLTFAVDWGGYLSKACLEKILLANFDLNANYHYGAQFPILLQQCGPIWGDALAKTALDALRRFTPKSNQDAYKLTYFLNQYGSFLPEAMYSDMHDIWRSIVEKLDENNREYHQRPLEQHIAWTAFRREMRKHITG